VGDSFEIENANGKHLHFIIAEESKTDHSSIILVYLSSSNTIYKDRTTIIKTGEHPYITKTDVESWIRYQNAFSCSRAEIAPLIINYFGKIPDSLLFRIQKGFEISTKVNKGIKKLYFEWKSNKLFDSLK
jgi:hypothetical protein